MRKEGDPNMSFLLATLSLLLSIGASQPASTPARNEVRLSASTTCLSPQSKAVVLEGTIEILPGTAENPGKDSAVVYDKPGQAFPAKGFGLTGETLTTVPGHRPTTKRLEFGEALDSSEAQQPLAQCTFSKVSSDSRRLTGDDVDELGIEEKLIGAVAEIETSIHGVAWVGD
jgi:hypothetical protein